MIDGLMIKSGVGASRSKTYFYQEVYAATLEYFAGSEFAAKVFVDKYALRDDDGNFLEKTPDDMHRRLAREFARIERRKFKNPLSEDTIYSYFKNFTKIIPQGSPMYAIGNQSQFVSASNCFVIESPFDSYGGILKADQELAQISKRRGGVGSELSTLRPNKSPTRNSSRTSTGIVPYMSRYSNTIREVGQDGRRGALMLTCDIRHPESVIPWDNNIDGEPFDVEIDNPSLGGKIKVSSKYYNPKKIDFTTAKFDPKKVTGANVSLRLTDVFMEAVRDGVAFTHQWPIDSKTPKIKRESNAAAAWEKIVYSAWKTAEPGILFWDTIIRESIADCYSEFGFKTISTNPCVTADTWILTSDGPRQVMDLVGKSFEAVVNGASYPIESDGFFFTGHKDVLKICLNRGQSIRVTADHKILTDQGWVEARDLKPGSIVILSNHRNLENWDGDGNRDDGYLVGSLLGDGCFAEGSARLTFWGDSKEEMLSYASDLLDSSGISHRSDAGTATISPSVEKYDRISMKSKALAVYAQQMGVAESKILDRKIEQSSRSFYQGFLAGWFDADGFVGLDDKKASFCLRYSSSILSNLEIAQRMLARLGVQSTIYKNRRDAGFRLMPDGCGGMAEYWCEAQHELHISRDNIKIFHEQINCNNPDKVSRILTILNGYERGPYRENFSAKVESIKNDGSEDVYDCTVSIVHEFDANGIRVHNCGEITLNANDSCRLIAINLFGFVKNPFTKDAYFDYSDFYHTAQIAQRLMDDLVDIEEECILRIINKIENDPEPLDVKIGELDLWKKILDVCRNGRRTGTGILAMGDTLAAIGIPYGSEQGISEVSKIYKTLKFGSYRSSIDMAKELGTFPIWDHDLEKDNPFLNRFKSEILELDANTIVSGSHIWDDMKVCGRRNIALLTTAPTGSISNMAKVVNRYGTSSGIEPQYSIKPYIRKKKGNPGDADFRCDSVDQNGDSWMHFKIYPPAVQDWMDISGETNEDLSPWAGHTAEEIEWTLRVKLQAAAQKHVDHSISSTVNLPNNVTMEKVAEIYQTAWEAGCKGITVYRDGCRTGVLVKDTQEASSIKKTTAPKRPKTVNCDVHHIRAKGEEYFVLVGFLPGSMDPYEVFAGKNGCISKGVKNGSITKFARGRYHAVFDDGSELVSVTDHIEDDEEAITRLVSTSLRHGADIGFIVHQLEKTKGNLVAFSKALSRALKKYIPDGTVVQGEVCPKDGCGGVLIRVEGCSVCRSCAWTKCN